MEALLPLIVQLVSGAIGGNVGGVVLKEKSLGTTGNSVAGAIGGLIGTYLLNMMMGGAADAAAASSFNFSDIASGGIGGIVLTVIAALIKGAMNKS